MGDHYRRSEVNEVSEGGGALARRKVEHRMSSIKNEKGFTHLGEIRITSAV